MVGNGQGLTVTHFGHTSFHSFDKPLFLRNLLCVQKIKKNLLNVFKFTTDNKLFIEFHSQFFLVKDSTTRKTLRKGNHDPSSGLYQLPSPYSMLVSHSFQPNNPSKIGVAFSVSKFSANMWH